MRFVSVNQSTTELVNSFFQLLDAAKQ